MKKQEITEKFSRKLANIYPPQSEFDESLNVKNL